MLKNSKPFFLLTALISLSSLTFGASIGASSGRPPLAPRGVETPARSDVATCGIAGAGLVRTVAPLSPDSDSSPETSPLGRFNQTLGLSRYNAAEECLFGSHYTGRLESCDGTCDNTGNDLKRYYCFFPECGHGIYKGFFVGGFIHKGALIGHMMSMHGNRKEVYSGEKFKNLDREKISYLLGTIRRR